MARERETHSNSEPDHPLHATSELLLREHRPTRAGARTTAVLVLCMLPTLLYVVESNAHNAQAFAVFDLVGFGDAYPGAEALGKQAEAGCYKRFAKFVGVSYEQSELYFSSLDPTEGSWVEFNDREIVCLLVPDSGTFGYDARNSRR